METLPRILVVDDDPQIHDLVRDVLSLIPCEMLSAMSVADAVALIRQEETALNAILLDLRIPESEEGFEVLKMVKSDPLLKQIPVIVVTGETDVKSKVRGLQMGADDYVTKPFDAVELKARVGVVLRIQRTEQMLRRRNEELTTLDDINRMITSSLDLNQVLASALKGLDRLVSAKVLMVVLNDEASQSWIIWSSRGPDGVWLEGRVVPDDDPVLRGAVDRGSPVLRHALSGSFWNESVGLPSLDVLCVPLPKRADIGGALVIIGTPHSLHRDYISLMAHLAATVAVAVENARLYQELAAFADELERSQNRLIQSAKMAAVGRLAASLAHEINNPLQAIQNSLHLAGHEGLTEPQRRRYLEIARHETSRLVQIVRRMLDFYRPATAMRSLDSNKPVLDALALASKRLQQAGIRVEKRLSGELPPVRGVENQLVQVFLNLILNAAEAMPNGGTLWIASAYHPDLDKVVVAFRDSGPGIPQEVFEHLFEPFHTTKATGTGLGLTISYSIIERHGGKIEAKNLPGGGASFIVHLPPVQEDTQ